MIGFILGAIVIGGVVVAVSRSRSMGYNGQGGSAINAVDTDSVLAQSPSLQPVPSANQIGFVLAIDPTNPAIQVPLQVVMLYRQILPGGVEKIKAKLPQSSMQQLLNAIPRAASELPKVLQDNGMYIQFSRDRIWSLGGIQPS